ncbi:MAG: tetratricopeptide repeat protein, partial [Methanospirillum sp.]|uniref:tetratricopeptide repeat protein n=1 Tax=Methanospirillum sp. TaxID=45200 RepID=UPI0023757636
MSFDDGMRAFKEGNYDQASRLFVAVTEQDENNHKAWNALGICLSKTGEYEQAGICFDNAVTLDPANPIYKKNQAKNDTRIKAAPEESLELDDGPVIRTQRQTVRYAKDSDPDVGRGPFWLGLTGFIFGILVSLFLIAAGGFFGAFGVSGSDMLGGRGWITIFLCLVGFAGVFVKHRQYGGLLLIL